MYLLLESWSHELILRTEEKKQIQDDYGQDMLSASAVSLMSIMEKCIFQGQLWHKYF